MSLDLPPGSWALFLILAFWVLLLFLGLVVEFFPHLGEKVFRKRRRDPEKNAS